ncbi:MAG: flippase-like domain-containing protein [Deltaproteobacteria bacterium]|nr:flippase-like domain-containing protein [Deltaproteobacteria bacterium]MBK8236482.1 flippase-like domain-containing protein [Deltaproteobacteria bacterium]MBP7288295.1 flippase-like domain-containing protein [Nannocystaceae bacterium]
MVEPSAARVLWLRLAVSSVLGGALLWVVWPLMAAVPADPAIAPRVLLGFALALVPYHGLRALRWWFLLRRLGEVSWRSAVAIGLAGYLWIAVLPLRLGELARPLMVAQRHGIAVGRTLAVVAVERIADGFVVAALFFATAPVGVGLADDGDALAARVELAAMISTALFAMVLSGLVVLARWPRLWRRLSSPLRRGRAVAPLDRIDGLLAQIGEGFAALSGPRAWPGFVLTTLAYWATNVAALWWLAGGCGLPLSLQEAALVTAVMNLALALPGGPAQMGVFQGGIAVGLLLVASRALVHDRGSVLAFWLYAGQLGSIVAVGLLAQRSTGVSIASLWRARPPQQGST